MKADIDTLVDRHGEDIDKHIQTNTWTDNYDSRQYIEGSVDPCTHDGWTNTQTHGQTWARRCLDINRQTEKHTRIILQMNKEGNINANRHVDRHRGKYTHTHTHTYGPRHALRRHRNRWTDRQTDRQTETDRCRPFSSFIPQDLSLIHI